MFVAGAVSLHKNGWRNTKLLPGTNLKMRNPDEILASVKSCNQGEERNRVLAPWPVSKKNLWLGMSLAEMLTNPISTPLPISDLHFFVLEGWKEKIPAYRGTVLPTHFQEQVSQRTWLHLPQSVRRCFVATCRNKKTCFMDCHRRACGRAQCKGEE